MDAKGIINLGLGQLGAYAVASIEPATSPIERRMATFYPQWRDSEMTKGRWVFTVMFEALTLAPGSPFETADRPYGFLKPANYLAPIKDANTNWQVRGDRFYGPNNSQVLEYRGRVTEDKFDPLFIDVLAARIALENCEWVTQSNMKKADAQTAYDRARKMAVTNNSLILEDDIRTNIADADDEWIQSRAGWNL